jgi:hypothetical protein
LGVPGHVKVTKDNPRPRNSTSYGSKFLQEGNFPIMRVWRVDVSESESTGVSSKKEAGCEGVCVVSRADQSANGSIPRSENATRGTNRGTSSTSGKPAGKKGFPLGWFKDRQFGFLERNNRGALSKKFRKNVIAPAALTETSNVLGQKREREFVLSWQQKHTRAPRTA